MNRSTNLYLLIAGICSSILASESNFNATARIKGLEAQVREERAMLLQVSLGEKKEWKERISQTEKQIAEQLHLMGYSVAQGKVIEIEEVQAEEISWIPDDRKAKPLILETRERSIPWLPKWGESLMSRRKNTTEAQGMIPDLLAIQTEAQGTPRHISPPEIPLEPQKQFNSLLPLVDSGTFSSTSINLPVPSPYQRGAWWLWQKTNGGAWQKIRSGWADQNIRIDQLSEGEYAFRFTKEKHQPGTDPEHFLYTLDVTAPTVEILRDVKSPKEGRYIEWICKDQQAAPLEVSLAVFNKDDVVLLSTDKYHETGRLYLMLEHYRDASRVKLTVKDKAGNSSTQWLNIVKT